MTKKKTENTTEELGFEAEVSKLLHMMVHSVYSESEIFLRELISNASDACDKVRYEALTNPDLLGDDAEFGIDIKLDKEAKTLTVSDNGVGMSRDDLIANLGTIAKSGTAGFMDKLTGDAKKDVQLIGQFGVGFYSVFMVADNVTVTTRKAGDDQGWVWQSAGTGKYTVGEADKATRGTEIVLHIKDESNEYLEGIRLDTIVRTYSDHIAVPIRLEEVGAKTEEGKAAEIKTLNKGSALWARSKDDVTEEQHTEFYRHVGHAYDEPAVTMHYNVEGMQEYTVLLYIPETQPMDLFDPARKNRVKLYVKRIYITDESQDLLPSWLRFLRGVVDSEDLPLNISREMLQNNPTLKRMSKAITKRVVGELEKLAKNDTEKFEKVWETFGSVIKEGIYEDFERKDQLLKLARFKSTAGDSWMSLEDYVGRMKEGQDTIYYVTGTDPEAIKRSPQLEGFRAKGVEVILMADAVDEFWLQMTQEFEGKTFKSITRGGSDLKDIAGDEKTDEDKKDVATEGQMASLTTLMKEVLGDEVGGVQTSDRLTETAVCLVADENAMDMHLERLLKAHNQLDQISAKVLEVNPSHPVIKALAERAGEAGASEALADNVRLLLDQALVLEGEPLKDPTSFARRLSKAMEQGLA